VIKDISVKVEFSWVKVVKATSPASDHCENLLAAMNMAEIVSSKKFIAPTGSDYMYQYALGIEVIDSEA
jgi:hypothetical protein